MDSKKKMFSYRVWTYEHCVSEELPDGLDRSEELWACRVRGANDGPVAMRDEIN